MSARRKRRTAFLSPRRITGSGGSRRPVTWSRTHASDTHNSRATSLVVRRRLDCRSTGPISSELCSRSRIRNLLSFFQNRLIAERSHRRIAHVPFHRLTHPHFAGDFGTRPSMGSQNAKGHKEWLTLCGLHVLI